MRGKEKCRALKEIRKQIAEQNDIEYAVSECTHQGECKGTCPKCEAELRYLERELAVKQSLGKAVAVVGISTSVCTSLTACSPGEVVEDFLWEVGKKVGVVEETTGVMPAPEEMDGDVAMPEPTQTPMPEDIAGGLAEEPMMTPERMEVEDKMVELMTPLPEVLEGDVAVVETPLPEILEGDVEVLVTPMPSVEGGIMPAPDEKPEEVLLGEIYIPVEGQE